MTAKALATRLDRIEAKRGRPALVIDRVIVGNGAAQPGDVVIVIGGNWRTPNHDANQPG